VQTVTDFGQLAQIEIGGTKGKVLTTSVQQIYADFLSAVAVIRDCGIDLMNVEAQEFDDVFYRWRCSIKVRACVLTAPPCRARLAMRRTCTAVARSWNGG
jgi:hypothetical protein